MENNKKVYYGRYTCNHCYAELEADVEVKHDANGFEVFNVKIERNCPWCRRNVASVNIVFKTVDMDD